MGAYLSHHIFTPFYFSKFVIIYVFTIFLSFRLQWPLSEQAFQNDTFSGVLIHLQPNFMTNVVPIEQNRLLHFWLSANF